MCARAVGLPNDEEVVLTDARSSNDFNLDARPRMERIVNANDLFDLFMGSMSLLRPVAGKTHLAVAIAYRAIQNGFDALFVTADELIDELSSAFRNGRLAETLARFTHPYVLVVDEVGYLTYGTDAANMLFHVVNDRHRRKRSMIFTTNKPLAAWGRVLHDEDLAQAIVDRVLERGRLLQLDGPSMRTRHLGLDDPIAPDASSEQMVRISGIQRSEFPEPTNRDGHRTCCPAASRKRSPKRACRS